MGDQARISPWALTLSQPASPQTRCLWVDRRRLLLTLSTSIVCVVSSAKKPVADDRPVTITGLTSETSFETPTLAPSLIAPTAVMVVPQR